MFFVLFFKQKTAYEMRISDWSSDVCSSDLHGEARHLRHVDAVVEHGDPGMADQPARLREGLIIERQMEHGGREICAQRPADLDRAHRAAARRAAADVVHPFAKRNAEADLIKAAVLSIAIGRAVCWDRGG